MTTFLQLSDNQNSDERLKLDDSANKTNMTSIKFSVEILVKVLKLVVTF